MGYFLDKEYKGRVEELLRSEIFNRALQNNFVAKGLAKSDFNQLSLPLVRSIVRFICKEVDKEVRASMITTAKNEGRPMDKKDVLKKVMDMVVNAENDKVKLDALKEYNKLEALYASSEVETEVNVQIVDFKDCNEQAMRMGTQFMDIEEKKDNEETE